jgi:hypothetical protein
VPFTNSARGQLVGILPTGPTQPALVSHLTGIVNAIEPKLIQWVANTGAVVSPVAKMLAITDAGEIHMRNVANTAWVKVFPVNYSGTAAPNPANFVEGDTYDRYV